MKPFLVIILCAGLFGGAWKAIEALTTYLNHPLRSFEESEVSLLPMTVNCKSPRYETLEFVSTALTLEEVAKFRFAENPALGLALEQVKFARGYYQMENSRPQQVIPLSDVEPEILKVEKVSYGRELLLDEVPKLYQTLPTSLLNKVVPKKSKALKVTYKSKINVVICGDDLSIGEALPLTLPRDPYLSFWYVSPKERSEVSNGEVKITTNPCVHDQAATLESPSHQWYVWRPEAKRGNVDCKMLLSKNQAIIFPKVILRPRETKKVDLDFSELKNVDVIQYSQVFGYGGSENTEKLALEAEKLFGLLNSDTEPSNELKRDQDISSRALYLFIKALKIQVDLNPVKVHRSGSSVEIVADGKLRHSQKKIQFHFWLGRGAHYQKGEKHWAFLNNALKNSHAVFYSGHADMGKAFDLKMLKALSSGPDYQFIGVMSCFSNSYFEQAVMDYRVGEGKKTDLLLTAFEGHPFNVNPVFIKYLDVRLAGKKISLLKLLSEVFSRDERISVQRF